MAARHKRAVGRTVAPAASTSTASTYVSSWCRPWPRGQTCSQATAASPRRRPCHPCDRRRWQWVHSACTTALSARAAILCWTQEQTHGHCHRRRQSSATAAHATNDRELSRVRARPFTTAQQPVTANNAGTHTHRRSTSHPMTATAAARTHVTNARPAAAAADAGLSVCRGHGGRRPKR